jgi:hypothetical protein
VSISFWIAPELKITSGCGFIVFPGVDGGLVVVRGTVTTFAFVGKRTPILVRSEVCQCDVRFVKGDSTYSRDDRRSRKSDDGSNTLF